MKYFIEKLKLKVSTSVSKIWYSTIWYSCVVHLTFEEYKKGVMFEERCKIFGSIEAIKMFSLDEFKLIRKLNVYKNKKMMRDIFFHPYKILKEFEEKDIELKRIWSNTI